MNNIQTNNSVKGHTRSQQAKGFIHRMQICKINSDMCQPRHHHSCLKGVFF